MKLKDVTLKMIVHDSSKIGFEKLIKITIPLDEGSIKFLLDCFGAMKKYKDENSN